PDQITASTSDPVLEPVLATWRDNSSGAVSPSARARSVLRRLFSFPALLGMLLVAGVVASTRLNLPDPDTWYHAAAGEEVVATRAWPTVDRYSFTAYGRDSLALEWLGDVVIAAAARVAGLTGMMLLLAAISSGLIILLYYYATLR